MWIYKLDKVGSNLLRDSLLIYYPIKKLFTRDSLKGVSARYTTHAVLDFEKFQNKDYLNDLFLRSRNYFSISIPDQILELGCGAGNLTIPLLKNTEANIFATDISRQQLKILAGVLDSGKLSHRVHLIQVDSSQDFFENSSFGLIVGSAIAHHLIDPLVLIDLSLRWLRVDGSLLLFEPVLSGSLIVRQAILEVLNLVSQDLPPEVVEFLAGIAVDIAARSDDLTELSSSQRSKLDDKSFVDINLVKQKFTNVEVDVMPILDHASNRVLSQHIENILKYYLLWEKLELLPESFWEILKRYDSLFSTSDSSPVIEGAIHIKRVS